MTGEESGGSSASFFKYWQKVGRNSGYFYSIMISVEVVPLRGRSFIMFLREVER